MSVSPIKSVEDLTADDIFKLPVHPAADVFPMLPEDELEELAEDIKARGLDHALVVQEIDGELTLIDGRNRRVACRRAGVEPTTIMLNGQDAKDYICMININRRHMSKGQRAMTMAMIYPDTNQGKRSKTSEKISEGGVSSRYVNMARTVLRITPHNAPLVLSGAMSLDAAYKSVQDLTSSANAEQSQLERLRVEAVDLAAKVEDGELSLTQAIGELQERERQADLKRHGDFVILNHALTLATTYGNSNGDFSHLSGHWDQFKSATRYSRAQLIQAFEQLERTLPKLLHGLRESED